MKAFEFKMKIYAESAEEAMEKADALTAMGKTFDGRTLLALKREVPGILADPVESGYVRHRLGLD